MSTDRHIFWKSLADMPGMGLPEGPTDQEPALGVSGAGFAPRERPFAFPLALSCWALRCCSWKSSGIS
ncbi:MAG: hypothetical protein ACLSGS_03980 [Adlercreutzia sp.]